MTMDGHHAEVDFYETLQVHERAIPEVIDKAYRVLVRRYHPDVHPPDRRAWAHRKMTQLNVAYDVLSDPAQRAEYDAARRLGRSASKLTDEQATGDQILKCFNHPKRPSVKFCWFCGRPICAECVAGERSGHTICTTCAEVLEREDQWRAGMDVRERERSEGPRMGARGVVLHYALLSALLGAVLWAVYTIAIEFGNTQTRSLTLVLGLAVVFVILVIQRLTWRVICPDCGHACGHAAFRANAPWREFLAPLPICPNCGHRFRQSEMTQTFD